MQIPCEALPRPAECVLRPGIDAAEDLLSPMAPSLQAVRVHRFVSTHREQWTRPPTLQLVRQARHRSRPGRSELTERLDGVKRRNMHRETHPNRA